MIFNPPYVETSNEELKDAIKKQLIEASWAGGEYDCLQFIVDHRDQFSDDFIFILLFDAVNKPIRMK